MALTGEDQLLDWLRRRDPGSPVGDDAALLELGGDWALTVDTQIEGVHFLPGLDPRRLARRLLAVNLSDLAAVGAEPRYALLALAAPPDFDHRPFFTALLTACRRCGVQLAGGDLATSPTLTLVLTLAGRRPEDGAWLRRAAARPGDRIWLGGTVGESAAGRLLLERGASWQGRAPELPDRFAAPPPLATAARRAVRRHLEPAAQLELGRWLGRQPHAAAIDLSDGLARDLPRLCRASGVGARIAAAALPLPGSFRRLAAALDADPLELALGGGEDYVLLFTLPAGVEPPAEPRCHPVGRIAAGERLGIETAEGLRPLHEGGWDHLAGSGPSGPPQT